MTTLRLGERRAIPPPMVGPQQLAPEIVGNGQGADVPSLFQGAVPWTGRGARGGDRRASEVLGIFPFALYKEKILYKAKFIDP